MKIDWEAFRRICAQYRSHGGRDPRMGLGTLLCHVQSGRFYRVGGFYAPSMPPANNDNERGEP